jgi:CheY-like chemotaxis protein
VLVVDDDPVHRDVVSEILTAEGYAVDLAADGEAGLAAARARRPDVILLDLLMPRMDGASFLQELRRDHRLSGVRVVVTTGLHTPQVRRLLRPDAVLFKPMDLDELLSAVAGVVEPARR